MRILSRIVDTVQTTRAYVGAAKAAIGGASGLRPTTASTTTTTTMGTTPTPVDADTTARDLGDPAVYLVETYRHNANVANVGRKLAEEERDDAIQALGKVTIDRDRLQRECERLAAKVLALEEAQRTGFTSPVAPKPSSPSKNTLQKYVEEELLRDGWGTTDRPGTLVRHHGTDSNNTEWCYLNATVLHHQTIGRGQAHTYRGIQPYRGHADISAAIARAVAAYDAAAASARLAADPQGNE